MNSTAKKNYANAMTTKKKPKRDMNNIKREHKKMKYPDIESIEYIHNEYNVEEVSPFSFEQPEYDYIQKVEDKPITKDILSLAIQSINI